MALTLEEATAIALSYWDGFDNYEETENAFVFGKSDDDGDGGTGPAVIMKEDGAAYQYVWALMKGMLGKPIRSGKLG